MKRIAAALTLSSLVILGYAKGPPDKLHALDFKGLVVGTAVDSAAVERALGVKCDPGSPGGPVGGATICNGISTIVDTPAQINVVIGADGVLDRVSLTVDSNAFDQIAEGFTAKFGRAQRTSRPTVQNSFGANFRDDEREWRGSNGAQLVIEKFAGSTDSSSIYFSTPRDRKLLNELGKSNDL